MYHTFFELSEPAFSIAVNPRYLYMSQQHKEALAHLLYGVAGGGFVMLTGEVGTGKTTIIRCLLEQMPDNADIAIVMNPTANVPELLTTICDELGASYIKDDTSIKDLTDSLNHYLLKNHTQGRNTVLLIDEAQLLSIQALEQIRLLTNLETTTQKLLHIILVGQPELKELLSKPELRQLAQRITARFHLTPLTLTETQAYIRHRLKVAGLPEGRSPFTFAIVKRIHAFTGGIPRLINVICERCLIGAYANSKHVVDNPIFNAARKEVIGGLSQNQPQKNAIYWKLAAGAFLIALVISTSYNSFFNKSAIVGKQISSVRAASPTSAISAAATGNSVQPGNPALSSPIISSTQQVQSSSAVNAVIRNYKTAEDNLFTYLGLPLAANTRPCGKNTNTTMQCEKVTLHTWTEVAEINRPAVLEMVTPEKFSTYLVLIGINQDNALVLNEQEEKVVLSLEKIGHEWTGDIFYLWRKPQEFSEPLRLGDTSDTIEWVAQQFAKLDKQKEPLTDDLFSLALHERVKIFQRSKGLPVDGIIDDQTLMKINEAVDIDKTLLTDF
jgi:general secretion pathway protein A